MQLSLDDDSEDEDPLDPCKELTEYLESKCCKGSTHTVPETVDFRFSYLDLSCLVSDLPCTLLF